MRIIYKRSGGIMGSNSSLTIDLDELPRDQAETSRRLPDEAHFFTLPGKPPTQPNPEGFQYTLTVESGTAKRTSERSTSDEL